MISEITKGQSYLTTLHFDKTVNAKVKKQMDLLVHYGSEENSATEYMASIMFGHCKAQDVVKEIPKALKKLVVPLKLQYFIGMEGLMWIKL